MVSQNLRRLTRSSLRLALLHWYLWELPFQNTKLDGGIYMNRTDAMNLLSFCNLQLTGPLFTTKKEARLEFCAGLSCGCYRAKMDGIYKALFFCSTSATHTVRIGLYNLTGLFLYQPHTLEAKCD